MTAMSQQNIEVEVKIHVDDLASIQNQLEQLGATLSAPRVYERNIRYDDDRNTLTYEHRVLRLRQDTRARLTYKADRSNTNGISARTELEVEVSDFDTTDLLLKSLGYIPAWFYEKYRTTYDLMECEVVLDEMPYGNFVEVEGTQETIEQVLNALGLAQRPRIPESYSTLFFRLKKRLGLTFDELTFENFRNVAVPDDTFSNFRG
jgi:adenylate cyclase, class 2